MNSQVKLIVKSFFCFFAVIAVFGPIKVKAECSVDKANQCASDFLGLLQNMPSNPDTSYRRSVCNAARDMWSCLSNNGCDLSGQREDYESAMKSCNQNFPGEYSSGAPPMIKSSTFLVVLITIFARLL